MGRVWQSLRAIVPIASGYRGKSLTTCLLVSHSERFQALWCSSSELDEVILSWGVLPCNADVLMIVVVKVR